MAECIHLLESDQCSICNGATGLADPSAVAAGLKAAESRSRRVALPPVRFDAEVASAVGQITDAGQAVSVSAVQRIMRGSGYEAGRKTVTASMRKQGLQV